MAQDPQDRPSGGGSGGAPPPQMSGLRMIAWFLAVMLFTYYWLGVTESQQQELSYTQFKERVRANEVVSVTMQGERITGQLHSLVEGAAPAEGQPARNRFVTTLPPVDDPDLMPLLEQHEVEVKARSAEEAGGRGC
ncbi:ATP-dependent metallopeptidase FtsH/Yme1/Tma family protein [Marinobacterium aestuariivivens]|uniref:ATP-dependent metallopeptidase FtsH/Yme1/Tma family protein n=1 Tax=Marinobacterium aestuariivivens TaxID=1698799 RepID=A0ABW1ZVT4_9GAMM